MSKALYRILVPYADNDGNTILVSTHRLWDDEVRKITGGLTIMGIAKGYWVSPEQELFKEKMIPVEIFCTRKEIKKILDFTLGFYNQKAVLAYKISDEVILRHA